MQEADFLNVRDHFNLLVDSLDTRDKHAFLACKHTREEIAYTNRNFIVYKMDKGLPVETDRIVVNRFHTDHVFGATAEIVSSATKRTLTLGYSPVRLFDYPVFIWLPLHIKLRWGASESMLHRGSLAFPVVIRTQSRLSLRETGITYCETGRSFGMEFNTATAE